MDFLPPQIADYADRFTSPAGHLLDSIEADTWRKQLMPQMVSGHVQGQILKMFSHMLNPSSIVELGTFTGYSALCLAEGLSENGSITTIDINEELESTVRAFIAKSPLASKVNYLVGNALEIIPQLEDGIDLAFIDADKENYLHYYQLLVPKMRIGGIIIADNVLWSGKVTDPEQKDKDTQALRNFALQTHADSRTENVLLPVRDGLMILRKIAN